MKFFTNNTVKLIAIAIVVFGLIFGVVSLTQNWGKNKDTIKTEAAFKELNKLYSKLNVNKLTPKKDTSITSDGDVIAVLPDIAEYPFVVNPVTDNFLTIYSLAEKVGTDYESWIVSVAESFNKSRSYN